MCCQMNISLLRDTTTVTVDLIRAFQFSLEFSSCTVYFISVRSNDFQQVTQSLMDQLDQHQYFQLLNDYFWHKALIRYQCQLLCHYFIKQYNSSQTYCLGTLSSRRELIQVLHVVFIIRQSVMNFWEVLYRAGKYTYNIYRIMLFIIAELMHASLALQSTNLSQHALTLHTNFKKLTSILRIMH